MKIIGYYLLIQTLSFSNYRAALWEKKLLEIFDKKEFDFIRPSRFTSRTLETELENNTNSVVPYFGVTIAIMVFFSVVTVMMCDWVRSKPIMGLIGVFSAVLSVIAAFGLLIYLEVPFIGINMAAPFLMLGKYLFIFLYYKLNYTCRERITKLINFKIILVYARSLCLKFLIFINEIKT